MKQDFEISKKLFEAIFDASEWILIDLNKGNK